MPIYPYRCTHPDCDFVDEKLFAIHDDRRKVYEDSSPMHGHTVDGDVTSWWPLVRIFSFAPTVDAIGDGYYDDSSGVFVTSKRQLDDHNKRASDAHTARTGVETNFVSHRIEELRSTHRPPDDQ